MSLSINRSFFFAREFEDALKLNLLANVLTMDEKCSPKNK